MARIKNALREHWIADVDETDASKKPAEDEMLELAKWITEITDDTDETSEEYGDYAGDGTPKTEIVSIAEKWTANGTYDAQDPAQALVASKKRKVGDERKVWHLIKQTDGKQFIGLATLSEIKAGTGEATEFEEFSCVINYDQIPEEVEATP